MENNTIMTDEEFDKVVSKLESLDETYLKLIDAFKREHPVGRTKPVIRKFLKGVFKRKPTYEEVADFMMTLIAQQPYTDAKDNEQEIKKIKAVQYFFGEMRKENKTFKQVTDAIESLKELKKQATDKKVIKDINHKIQKLSKQRQSLNFYPKLEDISEPSEQENKSDEVDFETPSYTYEPEEKKKTGSGTKTKSNTQKRNEIVSKRVKKNRKW